MKIFRSLFLILCFAWYGNNLRSQDNSSFRYTYFQSAGGSLYYSGYAFAPSLSYWFRFNYYEFNEFLSLSASLPLSAGGYFSSYSGGFFMVDLPVTADINFGNQANDLTEFPIGGFLGVGGGFNFMYGIGASRSYGPLLHAGLRVAPGGRNMTLRFSYLLGIGGVDSSTPSLDNNPNVVGVGIFYSL